MTYTVEKILDIIKMYHINIINIKEYRKDYASVGVTVYDVEATLPQSPYTTSDPVANEALRQVNETQFYSDMRTDLKYLQDRLYRVEDETDAQILNLTLRGYEVVRIADLHKINRSTVYNRLKVIAMIIQGYQQAVTTD